MLSKRGVHQIRLKEQCIKQKKGKKENDFECCISSLPSDTEFHVITRNLRPFFFFTFCSLRQTDMRPCACERARVFEAVWNSFRCCLQQGCDTDSLSCPSDPSELGVLIKVSLCTCFYEDLLNIWLRHLESGDLKEWGVCVCVWVCVWGCCVS